MKGRGRGYTAGGERERESLRRPSGQGSEMPVHNPTSAKRKELSTWDETSETEEFA